MGEGKKKEKKNYSWIPFILDLCKEIPKKKVKKFKKLKGPFPAFFLAKTEVGQEREKKFTPELCSYPTWARNFQIKNSIKIQKIKKVNSNIISVQNWLGEG